MPGWGEYWYPPRSTPRRAKGGIKARNRRGGFAESWWAKQWIATLESFHIGARLDRGRTYARKGQVTSLEIGKGKVSAKVQGSRARPYTVSIALKPIAASRWKALAKAATGNLLVAAKLMAGEMPPEIADLFAEAGEPLFPAREDDLTTDCSCPDWSNPCKHIAAVYYLLAEEFDRDPFVLFRLRGAGRDQFAALLAPGDMAETAAPGKAPSTEALTPDPGAFWSGNGAWDESLAEAVIPEQPSPLAGRLGGFPFWRGDEDFTATVSDVLKRAAPQGLRAFLGETGGKAKE